jgi:hypothetical protein
MRCPNAETDVVEFQVRLCLRIGIDSFAGEQRVIITGIFLFELLPSRSHHLIKGYLIVKQSAKI